MKTHAKRYIEAEFDVEAAMRDMSFDEKTGEFRWKRNVKRGRAGDVAGNSNGRYRQVAHGGVLVFAHRLVMRITTGHWPTGVVDHINGDKLDNRPVNLRDVSASENQANRKGAQKNNRTGLLGVHRASQTTFRASIQFQGKRALLGCFPTAEAAHDAYLEARRRLHG